MLAHNVRLCSRAAKASLAFLVSCPSRLSSAIHRVCSATRCSSVWTCLREFQRGFRKTHKAIVALRPINSGGSRNGLHCSCATRKVTAQAERGSAEACSANSFSSHPFDTVGHRCLRGGCGQRIDASCLHDSAELRLYLRTRLFGS
jgi:hypothetical protein